MKNKNVVLSVDLGTGLTVSAIMENGKYKIIPNSEGSNTTPSVVGFTKNGETVVGQVAKRQAITNPTKTIYGAKRLIGRKFNDPEVVKFRELAPFKIIEAKNGDAWVEVDGKAMSPEQISALVLGKMKKSVEDYLGFEVKDAVITCPAYFNQDQRNSVKVAGEIAGLNVLRIINEPTAAALAYGFQEKKDKKIMISDWGSGTLDFSAIDIGDGVIEVIASSGDSFHGGSDVDVLLMNYIAEEFKKESGVDIRKDNMALQRLNEAAEKAKIELSSVMQTDVNLPFITMDANGPKHLNMTVSRAKLESLMSELMDRFIKQLDMCVKDSGIAVKDFDEVILVGGSSRIPLVQQKLKEYFGKEPLKNVNPDEIVAAGAAVQGGILKGDVKDVLLLDVTPLSLGLETMGGIFTKLIEKNTTIPTRKSQVFSTAVDNQPAVSIHVLQGERDMASDNKSLARFDLSGINPAPRGMPQIEVTFDIDANGLVHVSAKDVATGKVQDVKITSNSGLSKEEIERMVKDAEVNREADKKRREVVEAKNNLEATIHQAEANLEKAGNKEELTSAISEAKQKLSSNVVDELTQAQSKLSSVMQAGFNQSQASGQAQAEEPAKEKAASSGEDVQDADFKEV